MTVVDFIKAKNAIIHKYTGIQLVPDNQIVEVEQKVLFSDNDAKCCPYCRAFEDIDNDTDCDLCIMEQKGNCCDSIVSTYSKVLIKLRKNSPFDYIYQLPEIKTLVNEYNLNIKRN